MNSNCDNCENDRYIVEGCCSGYQCGCMGQPTSITNCTSCNPEGDLEPSKSISDLPYFKYLEFRKSKLINNGDSK